MRHAFFVPPYGAFSDIHLVVELAQEAEALGLDGVFVWDHVMRPATEPVEIADTWVVLTAIAQATERITLGPLVTPITRRRPQVLARQTVSVDRLSGGRLVLGLGLGVDTGRELSAFGEVVDPRHRGQRLDEGVAILQGLWTGEPFSFHSEDFTVDEVTFQPTPVNGTIPMWFAARGDAKKPVRRAARHQGLFPVDVDRDQLARMVELVHTERGSLDGFDVVALGHVIDDDAAMDLGVTWRIGGPAPVDSVEVARERMRALVGA